MLAESGLALITADDLTDAAKESCCCRKVAQTTNYQLKISKTIHYEHSC